jgi:hypothetical protein
MTLLLKDSGLDGVKGTIQYCADCGKPTVHYRAPGGWPICSTCGYNADLMKLYETDYQEGKRYSIASFVPRFEFPLAK